MQKHLLILTLTALIALAGGTATTPTSAALGNKFAFTDPNAAGEVTTYTVRYWSADVAAAPTNTFLWSASMGSEIPLLNFLGGRPNGVYGMHVIATGVAPASDPSTNFFVKWWGNKLKPPGGFGVR
jgi:hypothetical protein